MANWRLSVHKVRKGLRLYHPAGLSIRAIAWSVGVYVPGPSVRD